ncbi:Small%2C acid-soluble spore proteins%2C alpha/beta type [uncultured Eubacterium sp.]|nr:Small%2C acid-soluble spore proteins%2C alpha/beta type [uncultured Eubacterium sp.]
MPKEKDFIEKTLEEMNETERLKYETAVELGLIDKLKENGWKLLSASETGRLGGIMNRKMKQKNKNDQQTDDTKGR